VFFVIPLKTGRGIIFFRCHSGVIGFVFGPKELGGGGAQKRGGGGGGRGGVGGWVFLCVGFPRGKDHFGGPAPVVAGLGPHNGGQKTPNASHHRRDQFCPEFSGPPVLEVGEIFVSRPGRGPRFIFGVWYQGWGGRGYPGGFVFFWKNKTPPGGGRGGGNRFGAGLGGGGGGGTGFFPPVFSILFFQPVPRDFTRVRQPRGDFLP